MKKNKSIIWETDLFHPHNDPDDHYDLATIYALAKMNRVKLEALLIDYTPAQRGFGAPDLFAPAQLSRMTGIYPPIITGSSQNMQCNTDCGETFSPANLRAADWIGAFLENADEPVILAVGGSSTDIALAGNRHRDVFEKKCAGIYLNAGCAVQYPGEPLEYNVYINPNAYTAMFELPCPVYWFPCFQRQTKEYKFVLGEHGTYFKEKQSILWENCSDELKTFFLYMLSKSEDMDWLTYIEQKPDDIMLQYQGALERSMYCTASHLAAAGLGVNKMGDLVEWEDENNIMEFIPICVRTKASGELDWLQDENGRHRLFHIKDENVYASAMCRALNKLLTQL